MHDQPKYQPHEVSDFFSDGRTSRTPVAGTVARGWLAENAALHRGVDESGQLLTAVPLPFTAELVERGRERFDIFCSPCHGRTGDGNGMIVQRGFKQPESFHSERLRNVEVGYFFTVMTNGFGEMSSYAAQVPVEDRWAVAAYIQALQLSRNAPASTLAADDLAKLDAPPVVRGEQQHHGGSGENDDHGAAH